MSRPDADYLEETEIMSDLLNDIAATGTLTTLGGPVLFGLCVANYFGKLKRKRNWMLFAPFIQAYVVIGAYIALFGLRISTSFWETVAFISLGSIISSIAVCGVIYLNTSFAKVQRDIPFSRKAALLRLVFPLGSIFILGILLIAAQFSGFDCLSDLRCRIYSRTIGLPGYAGAMLFPAFNMGVAVVAAYFAVFFMIFKEVKGE